MKSLGKIRWGITFFCLLLFAGHLIWPKISLDLTATILLIVALIPWLAPVVKSIELPGGFKIEVQDVKEATDKIVTAESEPIQADSTGMRTANVRVSDLNDALLTLRELAHSD